MAFTKILGPGIHTLANFHSHNINSSGIITATRFDGPLGAGVTGDGANFVGVVTCTGLDVNGDGHVSGALTITGNVNIGGTITYTDVTNIDAVGIITAQSGINISGNGLNVISGVSTFAGDIDANADIELAGNLAVTGVSTFTAAANFDNAITVDGSVGIADSIIHIGNTDTSIRFPSDDTFAVETAGSEALRIQSTGVVNIGDSTASSLGDRLLQIGKTDRSATYAEFRTSTTGVGGIVFSDGTASNDSGYRGTIEYDHGATNTDEMFFKTSALERLRITAAGELQAQREYAAVGINTFARFARKGNGGPHLEIGYNAVTTDYGYFGTGTAHDLGLRTNDVTRLRITTAGDVQFFGATAGVTSCLWDASANSLIYRGDAVTQTKAVFGNNSDVAIYNKTNFHIEKTGTAGSGIRIHVPTDESIEFQQAQATVIATFTANGSCSLYNNTVKRIETSSTGITVTGEVAATQDYPSYRPTLDFNFAAVKKLDPRFTYYRNGPASYIDEFGIVKLVGENAPRFDHDIDTGECKGLLIEDSRTNSIPYGTTPGDNWSGSKAGSTWIENTTEVKAPDGTYTATKWEFTTTDPYLYHQQTLSANTTYTMSVWVKAGTNMSGDVLQMRMGAGPYSTNANSTLSTDGSWKRLTFTKTVGGSDETDVNIGFEPQTASGNPAAGDSVYIWGAQLEIGSFATSFIPTYGVAATRGADFVSIIGDEHTDFWNTSEGTYLIDYNPIELAVGDGVIIGSKRGSNGSGYPWPLYRHDTATTNQYKSYDLDTGIVSIATAWVDQREVWVLGFNGTNGSIVRNGSQLVTNNASMKGLINANELWLGSSSTGSVYSMHVKRFVYYPKRVSDSQLVTLSS